MTQLKSHRRTLRVGIYTLAIMLSLLVLSMMSSVARAQDSDSGEFSRQELELLALSPQARTIAQKLQLSCLRRPADHRIKRDNSPPDESPRAATGERRHERGRNPDFFVERYGPEVLREPRPEGIGWGVWLAPPIIALFGLLIVFLGLRSGGRPRSQAQTARPAPRSTADDDEIVAREIGRMTRNAD